jgi:hypothetical protein
MQKQNQTSPENKPKKHWRRPEIQDLHKSKTQGGTVPQRSETIDTAWNITWYTAS